MVTPLKYIISFCPSYCNGCGTKKDYFDNGVAYQYLKICCTCSGYGYNIFCITSGHFHRTCELVDHTH